MEVPRFVMRFPETETDKANRYARSLADSLRDLLDSGDEVSVSRDNPESQDFGATLVLVLGTTAVTALAEGIKAWLQRNSGAQLEILSDGTVVAKNLESKDAASIAQALSKRRREGCE